MADANRPMTAGEIALLRTIFRGKIDYAKARVHSERWTWPFPQDRAMAPNGDAYFPGREYAADFSLPSVPLAKRATSFTRRRISINGTAWVERSGCGGRSRAITTIRSLPARRTRTTALSRWVRSPRLLQVA